MRTWCPVRWGNAATATLLAVLLFPSCGEPAEPRPRNLLLISIDTLRADHVGCYGHARPTTPALDALAAEGVLFLDASATSPWTKPSHASLLTGLYPRRNGVLGFEYGLSREVEHLAELLARQGFQTAAVVSNSALTSDGLERGFEHFEFVERGTGPEPTTVTEHALSWLATRDPGRPFFAFVHYNDPHADYRALPPYLEQFVRPYEGLANGKARQLFAHTLGVITYGPEDARYLSDLYDAAIRQLDDRLGHLFESLRAAGALQDTLVVVTSDHGEEFLEHGGVQHGLTQYEESVRVPLVFRGPGLPRGWRLSEPVSLVDVLPTCLSALGLGVPGDLDGVDLTELLRSEDARLEPRSLFFEADCAPPAPGTQLLQPGTSRAVRRGKLKLHYELSSGEVRLFDLETDPGEMQDVRSQQGERSSELLQELQDFLARQASPGPSRPLTEQELSRLRDLGYAGEE